MAPHGKELTTEQKEIILNLSNEVFSSYTMQSMTGINSRTIKKYLRRMRERGNIENLPRRGGIRKNILRDDTILFRSVKTNRRQIRIITKLPNSEQSYKGKVKTHNYINRQNQSTTGKLCKMKQQDLIKELAVMFHLEQFAEDCFWKGTRVE